MAINFPTNPAVGYQHPVGVKTYVYMGSNIWDLMTISDAQVLRAENAAAAAEAAAETIGTAAAFSDENPVVKGGTDPSKQLRFDLSGFTTATTRVLTPPNKSGTVLVDSDVDASRTRYDQSNATNAFDYRVAGTQRWSPGTSGTQTLSITNWPATGIRGELVLDVINGGAATLAWPAGAKFITSSGVEVASFPLSGIVFPSSGLRQLLVWTKDGGTTVYFKAA